MQLSIQTTESLQNKVGRKNTKQEKHTTAEKNKPHQRTKNKLQHKKNTKEKNQKRTKEPVPKEMEPYQFPMMEL